MLGDLLAYMMHPHTRMRVPGRAGAAAKSGIRTGTGLADHRCREHSGSIECSPVASSIRLISEYDDVDRGAGPKDLR